MKKAFKVIYNVLMIVGIFCSLSLVIGGAVRAGEAGKLYDKIEITKEDLKVESEYKTITTVGSSDSNDFYYKIRKLSGVEHVCQINLDDDEGVTVTCTAGDVKLLVMDEQGQQRFCQAATELQIYPGNAGTYDIYLVGKRYTGEVKFEY